MAILLANQDVMTFNLAHLAVAPLFILKVILCIVFLYVLRKDRGLLARLGKLYCLIFIAIYIIAIFLYVFGQ